MTEVEAHIAAGSEIGDHDRPADGTALDRKLVLVVDDEPSLLEAMRFALEGEGFVVETAKHGQEALAFLTAGRLPGLVLLDLMMPVMNGWELLEAIAKIPSLGMIPIVVVTAAGTPGVPGAAEVLRKPVDLGLLIDAVERNARGRE